MGFFLGAFWGPTLRVDGLVCSIALLVRALVPTKKLNGPLISVLFLAGAASCAWIGFRFFSESMSVEEIAIKLVIVGLIFLSFITDALRSIRHSDSAFQAEKDSHSPGE